MNKFIRRMLILWALMGAFGYEVSRILCEDINVFAVVCLYGAVMLAAYELGRARAEWESEHGGNDER